jgi:RecB family exonuclease
VSSTAAAAEAVAGGDAARVRRALQGDASSRAIGVLVHRLLQRAGVDPALVAEPGDRAARGRVRAAAARLLGDDEGAEAVDRAAWIEQAVEAFEAIRGRADVQEVLRDAEAFYEVPFSMVEQGRVVRGTIDCLVRSASGAVTVLEFKTGRPKPEHEVQAGFYRRAAQSVFSGIPVTSLLVYATPEAK